METPNTRARRKREMMEGSCSQEEVQGPSVAWLHDQNLRRAVLQAVENDVITPPTPTQKPRPISSRFSPSSSALTSTDPSTRPPRKRPCRNHRSLPHQRRDLASSSSSSPNTSLSVSGKSKASSLSLSNLSNSTSSNSYSGDEGKTRLDLLLERFQILNSSPDPPRVETRPKKKSATCGGSSGNKSENTPSRSRSLRGKEGESKVSTSRVSATIRNTSTPSKSRPSRIHTDVSANTSSTTMESAKSTNTLSSIDAQACSAHLLSPTHKDSNHNLPLKSSTDGNVGQSYTRNPLSPIKSGVAPRIGLGSQHKPKSTTATSTLGIFPARDGNTSSSAFSRTTSASGRAFKTPFLDPSSQGHGHVGAGGSVAGLRSSPRRAAANGARATSNITTSVGVVPVRGPMPGISKAVSTSTTSSIPPKPSPPSISAETATIEKAAQPAKRPSAISRSSTTSSGTGTSNGSIQSLAPTHTSATSCQNGAKGKGGSEFTNFDIGGNEGDSSFDSFDGIFADGGEEIEMLLRQVDAAGRVR